MYRFGGKYFSFCQYWSAQTQPEVADKVTVKTEFQAQYCPYKTNHPTPPHISRGVPSQITSIAPQTLLLAIMFCTPSPSVMSFFHTRVPSEMLGFQTQSQLSKTHCILKSPLVSQRNKWVCIIKLLSPQTQSLPYS